MRLLASVGILAICISQNAYAFGAFKSGNDLFTSCTEKDYFSQGACLGYISGIADELTILDVARHRPQCIPTNATVGQIVDVVKKYLSDHPESRNHAAADIVTTAIGSAWDCPKKSD